jgi:hypothetical protein
MLTVAGKAENASDLGAASGISAVAAEEKSKRN